MTAVAENAPAPAKRPRGGVTTFTDDLAQEICERLAEGEPLRQICRDDHMPAWRTVYEWKDADEDFAARIARARIVGADAIAEEVLEIADDDSRDWIVVRNEEGQPVDIRIDGEHVQRSKLRIETRLKLLAKWFPKKYGDRQVIAGDPDNPLLQPRVIDPATLSEAERDYLRRLVLLARSEGAQVIEQEKE